LVKCESSAYIHKLKIITDHDKHVATTNERCHTNELPRMRDKSVALASLLTR